MLSNAPARISAGLFALCMATLLYELALTRIFSVLMWYHFASMAISLALFGMGVAALTVYLKPGWFPPERTEALCARFALLFGLAVALFFVLRLSAKLFLLINLRVHVNILLCVKGQHTLVVHMFGLFVSKDDLKS